MLKKLSFLILAIFLVALVVFVGCEREAPLNMVQEAPSDKDFTQAGIDLDRIITILSESEVGEDDLDFLESLASDDWTEVSAEIERRGIRFLPEEGIEYVEESERNPITISSCSWNGTTRWNESFTRSRGYNFQGHHAVYFTVDANAGCYSKNVDWWVVTWVPGHGDVHNWDLLLYRDRYRRGSRWVKDVVLLVPTTWWSVYYPHWPSSFKAARFYLRWYHQNNGCCD